MHTTITKSSVNQTTSFYEGHNQGQAVMQSQRGIVEKQKHHEIRSSHLDSHIQQQQSTCKKVVTNAPSQAMMDGFRRTYKSSFQNSKNSIEDAASCQESNLINHHLNARTIIDKFKKKSNALSPTQQQINRYGQNYSQQQDAAQQRMTTTDANWTSTSPQHQKTSIKFQFNNTVMNNMNSPWMAKSTQHSEPEGEARIRNILAQKEFNSKKLVQKHSTQQNNHHSQLSPRLSPRKKYNLIGSPSKQQQPFG